MDLLIATELKTVRNIARQDEDGYKYTYDLIQSITSGLFGVRDESGEIVIKPLYQEVRHLCQSLFLLKTNDKFGIRDADEEKLFITPIIHDRVEISGKKIILSRRGGTEKIILDLKKGTTQFFP